LLQHATWRQTHTPQTTTHRAQPGEQAWRSHAKEPCVMVRQANRQYHHVPLIHPKGFTEQVLHNGHFEVKLHNGHAVDNWRSSRIVTTRTPQVKQKTDVMNTLPLLALQGQLVDSTGPKHKSTHATPSAACTQPARCARMQHLKMLKCAWLLTASAAHLSAQSLVHFQTV
jgi:hypothetical protein